jgi:hypothetical protein
MPKPKALDIGLWIQFETLDFDIWIFTFVITATS